ncbi:hypothetical protein PROFUN_03307 [Planoprotostelium fungivorum]|uniref:Saccharopine dehydrogenase NADP binding domain-containing protein n=1 Tax=Planoprotostelium fungivorum TaxID=1890364 RepID=A0A2P6NWQ7_9EUKA|nr:hypothetical protein PROFUN_03307 [Planoprotostelium fungivorum]
MNGRTYDLILFGATGFTGKLCVEEIAKSLHFFHTDGHTFRWAIAGRSRDRLKAIIKPLEHAKVVVDVVIADIEDEESLRRMARSTRIILSAVGPYRSFGEPLVKACIAERTDYLDLCGEPEFIENMMLKYHDLAVERKVTLVHAAAFDSVPADLGAIHAVKALRREHNGVLPSSVEMFLRLQPGPSGMGVNYATYECAVEGFGSVKALKDIRRDLAKKRAVMPHLIGKKPIVTENFKWDGYNRAWRLNHFFADASVVRTTQILNASKPHPRPPAIHFVAHVLIPSTWALIQMIFFFTIFSLLAKFSIGRKILLEFPEVFTRGIVSKRGPSARQRAETSVVMSFLAAGYSRERVHPDQFVRTAWTFPEPGYVATPILFVHSAAALYHSRHVKRDGKVPTGVNTPGYAFEDSDLEERLLSDSRIQVETRFD